MHSIRVRPHNSDSEGRRFESCRAYHTAASEMTLAAVFMCCVKMHSCCSEPFPFQLQPSCDRGSVHCFAGFYSAVHGGFAASEHPCDARNGALYEENLPVTEYAQYVRALVHGEAPDDICCVKNLPRAERSWQQKSYFISLSS